MAKMQLENWDFKKLPELEGDQKCTHQKAKLQTKASIKTVRADVPVEAEDKIGAVKVSLSGLL